jgi:hypothetical protein
MIKTLNQLKSLFSTGNQATEDSFEDLIDSYYGKAEDSILIGPLGLTGTYGLIGPSGGTYLGLLGPSGEIHYNGLLGPEGEEHFYGLIGPIGGTYLGLIGPSGATHYNGLLGPEGEEHYNGFYYGGSTAPSASSDTGNRGQIRIVINGDDTDMYIHDGSQWWKLPASLQNF